MNINVFGARGSIPTPLTQEEYGQKIRETLALYSASREKDIEKFIKQIPPELSRISGGNTSCIEIEDEEVNDKIIIDAGSGLRVLGGKYLNSNNLTIHIFISHFHWDHICGAPFFKPLYNPTNKVIFYSACDNMIENLERQQHPAHFPISFKSLPAVKSFVKLDLQKTYQLAGFSIRSVDMRHPGGSTSYVFSKNGKKISYVTDTEFTPDNKAEKELYYKACFEGSDILILDSQYSLVEFFNKFEWGHTSSTMATNLALEWRVKKLLLFHFDPEHTDEDLIKLLGEANKIKDNYNKRRLSISLAVEGSSYSV